MRYPSSIMTGDMTKCYLCGSHEWIEIHHIMGGPNRAKSTKYGLVVPLCRRCHNEPPDGVHFNRQRMDALRAEAQAKFEERYPDLDWLKIFGRNYK